jgi:hypothetical protein
VLIIARVSVRGIELRDGDLAHKAFAAPIEAHGALELVSDHPFDHACAEALTRENPSGENPEIRI